MSDNESNNELNDKTNNESDSENDDFDSIEEFKLYFAMNLFVIGDRIGHNNGNWSLSHGNFDEYTDGIITYNDTVNRIIDFINKGGVNTMFLSIYKNSELIDIMIGACKLMLKYEGKCDEKYKKYFLKTLHDIYLKIKDSETNHRLFLVKTIKYHENNYENVSDIIMDYEQSASNRICVISMIAGLVLGQNNYTKNDFDDFMFNMLPMIDSNPYSILGAHMMALFAYYSIKNINIKLWPIYMINEILDAVEKNKYSMISENIFMIMEYCNAWKEHIETRFKIKDTTNNKINTYDETLSVEENNARYTKENVKLIKIKSLSNPVSRANYHNKFRLKIDRYPADTAAPLTFIVYDAVLDCGGIWEKLLMYSALSIGDSSAVGSMAAMLYGSYYNRNDFNMDIMDIMYRDYPKNKTNNENLEKELRLLFKKLIGK